MAEKQVRREKRKKEMKGKKETTRSKNNKKTGLADNFNFISVR